MAAERVEKFIFYLLVFSIPFQTRLIISRWTTPFNEWTSAFVYGTDVLLAILLAFWLLRSGPKQIAGLALAAKTEKFLLLFLAAAAVSTVSSSIIGLSLFRLLKLLELSLFYLYVKNNFFGFLSPGRIVFWILASGLIQAATGAIQYLIKSSLGLRFFGESFLSISTYNVAIFEAGGETFLRAYGTTPHPNVLAAWLVLAIFAFYILFLNPARKQRPYDFPIYAVLLFGFFLTFSRTAIALWLATVVIFGLYPLIRSGLPAAAGRPERKKTKELLTATFLISLVFVLLFWPQVKARADFSITEEAVSERIFYGKAAGGFLSLRPLLGDGPGQFVPRLMSEFKHYPARFYQPVHNIYLLLASEVGILGLAFFLTFLFFLFSNFVAAVRLPDKNLLLLLSAVFLLMGFFDHFFLTIQQGSLSFWLVMAIVGAVDRNVA